MQQARTHIPQQPRRHVHRWLVSAALAFAGMLALVPLFANQASGAGTLVVIEDASQLGNGSFSGNVCYQLVRDSDGVTLSEGCFSIAATIAAPEGFDTSEQYTIHISLADDNCDLLDDPRTGNGAVPFTVRVTCDDAFMTATASAGGPPPTETPEPADPVGTSAPVELTAWPPVYDLPTATIMEPVSTAEPAASPIPMFGTDQSAPMERGDASESERDHLPGDSDAPQEPESTVPASSR